MPYFIEVSNKHVPLVNAILVDVCFFFWPVDTLLLFVDSVSNSTLTLKNLNWDLCHFKVLGRFAKTTRAALNMSIIMPTLPTASIASECERNFSKFVCPRQIKNITLSH